VDREGLSFRMLAARYGLVGGQLPDGVREGSVWWRTIASIQDGDGLVSDGWFSDNLSLNVGNGANTLFWLDRWVGKVHTCVRFRRLYDLSDNKLAIVAQMSGWGWNEGGEAWKWRRRLWAWEEALVVECTNILSNVILQVDSEDSWRSTPDPVARYTVSGAYRVLTSGLPPITHVPADQLWRKDVPLKVSVFAWRLFRNKLPSKTNLFRRGIIPFEAQWCVSGCGHQESESHLFLTCSLFGQFLQLVRSWLGVYSADPSNIQDHFYLFCTSSSFAKSRCSLMHLIWFVSS